VNQQRHVVDAVKKAGRPFGLALEVGSKPELLAVLAMHDDRESLFLCNGYKDNEYIELALLARKMGHRSIIIVEQFYELQSVLEIAQRIGVEPEIGFRFKPFSKSAGKWETSSGENAKFGLTANQIIRGVALLKEAGKDHWLKLLHMHMGSQVSSIVAIKRVLREATRVFVELKTLCPSLCMFDVGGGLGVDYDGSNTNFECSVDYSVDEYARDVVWAVGSMCEEMGLDVPEIISESGRATVAHHAVLVTEVTDVAPGRPPETDLEVTEEWPASLSNLASVYGEINAKNYREMFHDAIGLREEVLNGFLHGEISLEYRAKAEDLFRSTIAKAREFSLNSKSVPEEIQAVDKALRDTYFCSFSLFQSMPDSWAIDQLFPIMPIHRLQEEPTRPALIADLTCDSDGKVDQFIDLHDIKVALPLHTYVEEDPYYLGIFLVGAYQEILGDLHNLFGDTNAVHIELGDGDKVQICDIVEGDTIRKVLSYVQYDPQELHDRFRTSIEQALEANVLSPEESAEITRKFRASLDGYTYFVK
ncbi:MAG: biosynthetic arginine decarboxylase, partial [Bdellovibrionales bacterium]|nr:biosynthetic arginine decarboxylase [Bdellovibrionales bacterium]